MEEPQGIYRGEVLTIMGALVDIHARTAVVLAMLRGKTTMKKKKWTPEERREWEAAHDARQRELQEHIERIKAELEARKKPA